MPHVRLTRRHLHAGIAVSLWLFAASALAEPPPLPEPLTLEHALSLADEAHPQLLAAEAELSGAHAERLLAESATGASIVAQGRLQWVEPSPIAADQSSADHRLALILDKPLYDFGRSRAAETAGAQAVRSGEYRFLDVRQQRRLAIMRRYFDVLLADMVFLRENEAMAVVFVALDRLRDRHELGQISDIELLEQETRYQEVRRARTEAQNRQRATRALLAQALGRPGNLPSTLATPELPDLLRELPDVDALQTRALEENLRLRALRAQVEAATARVAGARAGGRPVLSGRLEAYAWERRLGSSDDWRAGLVLDVPLVTGGRVDARVAGQQAELQSARARLAEVEYEVRQAVLETWLQLDALRIQLEEAYAMRDYRELYLDRSRALYELEVATDLGDSMVRMSEAQLGEARAQFELAMAWARLQALTGDLLGGRLVPASSPQQSEQAEQ